jgi:diguanylate cyclase (GGDEF)-like protein
VSRDGATVSSNQAWTDLVGPTPPTSAASWLDALHTSSRGHALAAVADASDQSGVITDEWRLAGDDNGAIRTADARIRQTEDHNVLICLWEIPGYQERKIAPLARATHDLTTGLPTREVLADRTREALARLGRRPGHLTLLLVDIDGFEAINGEYGRHIGDRVLVAVGAALAGAVRPSDHIARMGGDRFGVLCEDATDDEAATISQRLRDAVSSPIDFGDLRVQVSATVVVARTRDRSDSFDALVDRADRALYFSKRTRRISEDTPALQSDGPPATNVRVMIVDDRNMVAEALMLSLQQHGFAHVALARNVAVDGVVTAAKEFAPDVALVESELMGEATSMSLIRTLDEKGIVVVMLTDGDEPERSAMCLEAGAVGIFDKSRALEDLVGLVNDAAMGRTVLQPASRDALLEVVRSQREEAERRLAPFQMLTGREQAVLAGLMDGKTAEVIAKEHNVSLATIRTQIRAVLQKLGVKSQLGAVALAIRANWRPAT